MRITVFTPTYNRANLLERLYRSLQAQTFADFEWLVIDDGSTDHTEELFPNWINENNNFQIRYYWFENSGKPREINRALDLAEGELFFTVDSDDIITPNALELIDLWEKALPKEGKYCGVAGSDGDMDGTPTNPIFDAEYTDATFFNRYPDSGKFIGYDRPWVFYTEIHRQYKYPEFDGEKFITEAVVWNRMAHDGYRVRCFNEVVYLWEHQELGLTANIQKTLANNPKGFGLWQKELMNFLNYGTKKRFLLYYSFYASEHEKLKIREIAEYVGAPFFLMILTAILFKTKHIMR